MLKSAAAALLLALSSLGFAQVPNNTWVSPPSSDITFIFVHGIFSNADSAWRAPNSAYWPSIVANDARLTRLGKPSVFAAGYYTSPASGIYSIQDAANELLTRLKTVGDDSGRPPLDHNNIVFVAHSTGGLVVRYLLEKERELFQHKAVGLVLVASPSRGSGWANRLRWIREAAGNDMGGQLEHDNLWIRDLDSRFGDLVAFRKIPRLAGIDLFENKFVLKRYLFLFPLEQVVPAVDQASYFGGQRIVPDTDHFSISKPSSRTHASHAYLVSFFNDVFVHVATMSAPAAPASPRCTSERPCVDIDRIADFTQLSCENGQKSDVVTIEDKYVVFPTPAGRGSYRARAELLGRDAAVILRDGPDARSKEIPTAFRSCEACDNPVLEWQIPMRDGVAKANYEFRNVHGGNEEGLAFKSNYSIRNLSATYKMPATANESKIRFTRPRGQIDKCSVDTKSNRVTCEGLDVTPEMEVQVVWRWDVWNNCGTGNAPQ